jgi:CHAT domain-containing protein
MSLSDEGITVLTLDKNGLAAPIWIEVDSAQVVESVESYLQNIEIAPDEKRPSAGRNQLRVAVKKLSSLIILPLSAALQRKDSIIFIPSGCLFRFPFSALELNGEPLFMHDKAVTICPSLAALDIIFRRSDRVTSSDKVGTIIVDSDSLSLTSSGPFGATPYAIVEANYLSARLETAPILAETLDSERRKTVLETSGLLHLAAHGTFERQSPLLASIQFQDPIRVIDLGNLKLQADLVVFRACVSGLGRYTDTDDMTGFAHMLLKTGANAFIGSLWNTADRFNALLMVGFYNALSNKASPNSIAKALAVAQKELYTMDSQKLEKLVDQLLEDYERVGMEHMLKPTQFSCENYIEGLELEENNDLYRDPCYWAPFVLVGNGEAKSG